PYFVRAFQPLFRDSIDEARMDTILRGDAVDYATAHPGYLFAATVLNSLRSLDIGPAHSVASRAWYYEMGTPRGVQFLVSATADLMIVFAAAGIVIRYRRRRAGRLSGHLFVWLVPVLMCAATMPING